MAQTLPYFAAFAERRTGKGRPGEMQMRWNTIVFDPAQQRGAGEFTFRYGTQVHGVAVIDIAGGRIAQWREYWYESEKSFEQFVEPSRP